MSGRCPARSPGISTFSATPSPEPAAAHRESASTSARNVSTERLRRQCCQAAASDVTEPIHHRRAGRAAVGPSWANGSRGRRKHWTCETRECARDGGRDLRDEEAEGSNFATPTQQVRALKRFNLWPLRCCMTNCVSLGAVLFHEEATISFDVVVLRAPAARRRPSANCSEHQIAPSTARPGLSVYGAIRLRSRHSALDPATSAHERLNRAVDDGAAIAVDRRG